MKKIPFFLVTGFLGSGKTTFLKRILEQNEPAEKVAIIQNEFAPASIDGSELKRGEGNFEILEINNGSVFCVCLLGSFIESLEHFVKKHQPDLVFLEASGLSDPIAIAQLLESKVLEPLLYLAKVWTLVDAKHFSQRHKLLTRLQHQVRIADVVIINKVDLVGEEEIGILKKEIKTLNPFARIETASFCKGPEQWSLQVEEQAVAIKNSENNAAFERGGRPGIGAGVLKSGKKISRENLEQLINTYSKSTIRIKGFVLLDDGTCLGVQTSFRQKEYFEIADYPGNTELIAMGEAFKLSDFSRDFRNLVR